MKPRLLFLFILLATCISIHASAQNKADGLIDIRITPEDDPVLGDIKTSLKDIIQKHGIELELRDDARDYRNTLNQENSRRSLLKQEGLNIPKDTLMTLKGISLSIRRAPDAYSIFHEAVEPDKQYDASNGEEIMKKACLLSGNEFSDADKRAMCRLVAYEIFDRYFVLSEEGEREKRSLEDKETDLTARHEKAVGSAAANYTLLSFVPAVNQFRSHTPKGTANGIAVIAGMGLSTGAFIISTSKKAEYRRKIDGVTVDLTEAEKEREFLRGKAKSWGNVQLASAIVFAGSYIYGVLDALVINKSTYQKSISLSPVAYEGGAGVSLVYRF